jgi:hypothetical protein
MMPRFRPGAVLATLSWIVISVSVAQAVAEEFRCQRGDLVRRIELRLADDAGRLPCAVIYWRDSEAPGQPQNLWNADHDLDFCRRKAREMAERLQSAGWACEGAPIGATAATGAPERSSPDPERPEEPAGSQGSESASPTARPDQATLRAALARDIRRLEELTAGSSGEFATDTATLGDLNADGLEDAAVLLTHRAKGAEPTYYLLAYVFNGATFQPVARINLEAYYRNFTEVGIQDVAGGAVDILLRVPRADDPQCCPSGRRQATFGLRDGQLVLLKESEPGA